MKYRCTRILDDGSMLSTSLLLEAGDPGTAAIEAAQHHGLQEGVAPMRMSITNGKEANLYRVEAHVTYSADLQYNPQKKKAL